MSESALPPLGLLDLPPELLVATLVSLSPRELIACAGTSLALAAHTEEAARRQCASLGILRKGRWCRELSWRRQRHGRVYRSFMRIRRHVCAQDCTATRSRNRSLLEQPTAVVALSDGAIAVCNSTKRCVSLFAGECGSLLRHIPIDGIPCGACLLGDRLLAIAVQGLSESGEVIEGVSDRRHRIETLSLGATREGGGGEGGDGVGDGGGDGGGNGDEGGDRQVLFDGDPLLSYPNGVCALIPPFNVGEPLWPQENATSEGGGHLNPNHDANPSPSSSPNPSTQPMYLAATDWNHGRVLVWSPFLASPPAVP